MAYKRSDLYLNPNPIKFQNSPRGYLNPEPSEEPIFHGLNTLETKAGTEKSFAPCQEALVSTDMNSSSMQISTQQSVNFKRSFFLNSPRRSIPSTPFLLSTKLKTLQDPLAQEKLEKKIKELEDHSKINNKSEILPSDSLIEIKDQRFYSVREPALEESITFEGENDIVIPHLRWCAFCKAEVTTKAIYVNNQKTFWSAVGIFLTGGVLGCFLLPYMTNSCKGVKLICKNCERTLL